MQDLIRKLLGVVSTRVGYIDMPKLRKPYLAWCDGMRRVGACFCCLVMVALVFVAAPVKASDTP